ncbi:MAG: DNA polymerase Y family protein [Alphaproteobacteria bacterium]
MASSKSTTRRILALWLPRLPTDRLQRRRKAARRTQGALDRAGTQSETPLVIAEKIDNALQISALDREASALGLKVGMTLASARAMLPELDVAQADADADRHTLERIASWCERFTPFVALSPPRTALLDITGCAHLFGGESALLASVTAGLIAQGFAVRAAIAGSAAAACALARYMDGAIAPPGADAALLAPLPVEALNLDPVTVHAFRRAGLKTIGAIAARGRAELTARFGAELVFLLEQALGRTEKPITPRRPLPDFSAEHRFAEPVVTEAAALAALEELARALCLRLERHARGARHIEARFFRTDGAVRTIAIETAGPSRDPGMILRLFQEKLGALADPLDPGFGYDLIRLCAARTERAGAEATDFDAQAHAAREVRFLVDRLTARFGKARVLVFEPRNTHIPERAFATVPAQEVSAYGCLSLPSICLARPCAEHPEPQTHVLAATGSSGQARGRQSCVSVSNNLALAVQVQQKNPPSLWEGGGGGIQILLLPSLSHARDAGAGSTRVAFAVGFERGIERADHLLFVGDALVVLLAQRLDLHAVSRGLRRLDLLVEAGAIIPELLLVAANGRVEGVDLFFCRCRAVERRRRLERHLAFDERRIGRWRLVLVLLVLRLFSGEGGGRDRAHHQFLVPARSAEFAAVAAAFGLEAIGADRNTLAGIVRLYGRFAEHRSRNQAQNARRLPPRLRRWHARHPRLPATRAGYARLCRLERRQAACAQGDCI